VRGRLLVDERDINEGKRRRRTSSASTTSLTTLPIPACLLQVVAPSSLSSNQSVMARSPPSGRDRTRPVAGLSFGCGLKKGGRAVRRRWRRRGRRT